MSKKTDMIRRTDSLESCEENCDLTENVEYLRRELRAVREELKQVRAELRETKTELERCESSADFDVEYWQSRFSVADRELTAVKAELAARDLNPTGSAS